MSTERTVRLGYRGHLIEVTLERRPDGLWNARWMVFATRPFLPRRQVTTPGAHPSETRAQSAAVTQAMRWIDSDIPAESSTSEPPATQAPGGTAVETAVGQG